MVVATNRQYTILFMPPLINLGEMKEATDAMLYACMINEYVPTTSSIHSKCAERSHGVFCVAIKKNRVRTLHNFIHAFTCGQIEQSGYDLKTLLLNYLTLRKMWPEVIIVFKTFIAIIIILLKKCFSLCAQRKKCFLITKK